MNLKALLLGCLCFSFAAASAQDRIYKKSGEIITGEVTEVSKKTVLYKRSDNPKGPEYAIDKAEIEKIRYDNGSEDVFENERGHMRAARTATPVNYGKNIIAIAPLQVTEHGVGVGLSYERALDKDGYLSFYLPLAVTFSTESYDPYYGGYPYNYNNGYTDPFFYAMPGIKFYPTGMYGKVRYGVGPSILVCAGQTTEYNGYYGGPYYPYSYAVTTDRLKLGIIINNSLNLNVSRHMYLGMEMGLGLTYLNLADGYNQNIDGLVQFAFRIGYRF